jgi:superfamily II DNA or RNA helicase
MGDRISQDQDVGSCFTDEHHLQLLQLQTRRAISERRRKEPLPADREDDNANEIQAQPSVDIPLIWRLLPTSFRLYAWQKECLPLWLREGRGTIKVATGGGKTAFALYAAQKLQNTREPDLRLVVVVPTIPLMNQWYDEVMQGNLPSSAIGRMGGGYSPAEISEVRILICVLNSARDKLPDLVAREGWANRLLLVVDECHRSSAEQARRIFDAHPQYALGLSATPEKDTGAGSYNCSDTAIDDALGIQDQESETLTSDDVYDESVVGQALGPIIYDFSLKDALEANLLTQFEIWHIGLSLSQGESDSYEELSREISNLRKSLLPQHRSSKLKLAFIPWVQALVKRNDPEANSFNKLTRHRKLLLYKAKARTDIALGILIEELADPLARCIIFHESIEEIEALYLRALKLELPVVLEHSKLSDGLRSESIDAFRRGIARVIISAKSLVEGFNVPSADLGIIAASSASVRQRIQSLGRMLRRKEGGRYARVFVLYIRKTRDEDIYGHADWESIIGAGRNRYFHWAASTEGETWTAGLTETSNPPETYRPPSINVDVSNLKLGDPYPGRPDGIPLYVDKMNNLRVKGDDRIVPASREHIHAILELNPYGLSCRTAAGHLIVRVDAKGAEEQEWRFIGLADPPVECDEKRLELKIIATSGRREITRRHGNKEVFARGEAREELLKWIREKESECGVKVYKLFWDESTKYWIEIYSECHVHPDPLPPLEFGE